MMEGVASQVIAEKRQREAGVPMFGPIKRFWLKTKQVAPI